MEKHRLVERRTINVDKTGIYRLFRNAPKFRTERRKTGWFSYFLGIREECNCRVQQVPLVISFQVYYTFPDRGCLLSLERAVLLEPFVFAPKPGGLMKNCSLLGLIIFRVVSNLPMTVQYFLYWKNRARQISLRICNNCKDNRIIAYVLPHIPHRIQPPWLTLQGPLKAAFNSECNLHLKRRAHKEIMRYELV